LTQYPIAPTINAVAMATPTKVKVTRRLKLGCANSSCTFIRPVPLAANAIKLHDLDSNPIRAYQVTGLSWAMTAAH
jgi:hypothetical protein